MRTRETKKQTGQPQLGTPETRQKPRRGCRLTEMQRQAHRPDRENAVRKKESQPGDSPSGRAGETQEIVSTQLS